MLTKEKIKSPVDSRGVCMKSSGTIYLLTLPLLQKLASALATRFSDSSSVLCKTLSSGTPETYPLSMEKLSSSDLQGMPEVQGIGCTFHL